MNQFKKILFENYLLLFIKKKLLKVFKTCYLYLILKSNIYHKLFT